MRVAILLTILCAVACKSEWYGTSNVYAWNGTDQIVKLQLEGTDSLDLTLRPQSGELLRDVTAGPYTVVTKRDGQPDVTTRTELRKSDLTILNVDGLGCFARADVAGKYSANMRFPVQIVSEYSKDAVIRIDTAIDVLPGEILPAKRTKSAYGFYRVSQVPCELIGDRTKMAEHLKDAR
jgi:hypothetical protein